MKKRNLFLSTIVIIALSACNLPAGNGDGGDETDGIDDLALTVTAQYLLLNQETNTPEFTATPEFTSTPELTATPSVPQVTVSVNTNCRTGPGLVYDLLGGLNIGQIAEVVGKSSSTGYWIVKLPGSSTICWLFPQHATVSGNTANLPEYPVPPTPTPTNTPTPTIPTPVSNLTANKVCSPNAFPFFGTFTLGGTITWNDESNNEKGFNVYFNGTKHGSVGPNVESYPIPAVFPVAPGTSFTMGVEAFNDTGKSSIKEVTFSCP